MKPYGGAMRTPRLLPVLTVLALSAACSGGSSGSSPKAVGDTSALAHKDCGSSCSGTLSGAQYKVELPTTWNRYLPGRPYTATCTDLG